MCGPCIGHIEIVKSDKLHDLLPLVHVALRQWHKLVRLQVKFGGVRVASSNAL